ncbi:potassium channel subfamily K member 18 [Suncus etruscus]|uniref:potassium channel subfamily K member 18 n=1 Tax=Suncus etruscus TaxID=109475 RepID=UPI0021101250|nr:potassium channel subfamily K member 18 [Suncus etruscus]
MRHNQGGDHLGATAPLWPRAGGAQKGAPRLERPGRKAFVNWSALASLSSNSPTRSERGVSIPPPGPTAPLSSPQKQPAQLGIQDLEACSCGKGRAQRATPRAPKCSQHSLGPTIPHSQCGPLRDALGAEAKGRRLHQALSASADQARTLPAVRAQPGRPHMHLGARLSMEEAAGLPRGPVCGQSALGKLLPRLCFLCSLVTYALLGALLFSLVEGGREPEEPNPEFEQFIKKLRDILKCNDTVEESQKHDLGELLKTVKPRWFSGKSEWSFLGSLFFCCTVFSTVGYGHLYPVTRTGKYLCMFYALFGIPLMFLVLTDLGDDLAAVLSKAYRHISQLLAWAPRLSRRCSRLLRRHRQDTKPQEATLPQIIIHEQELLDSPKPSNNLELFERLLAQDKQQTLRVPPQPLKRSSSCPQLVSEQLSQSVISNQHEVGRRVESLDVPLYIVVLVVLAYISCAAALLPMWEEELDFENAFYFCFITLTTIGFGDIALQHPHFFMFFSIYILIGMEILCIAFRLVQNRLLHAYKHSIFLLSKVFPATKKK